MAKTFDNISEASATNYLFLFAQRTLALQNEPATPPPLNVLGLPCHTMSLLWAKTAGAVKKKPSVGFFLEVSVEAASAATAAEQAAAEAGQAAAEAETEVAEAAETEEVVKTEGKDKGATFPEKIKPLAKKITEYILDHQDDAAQEDRWRTTMKRETMKCFREQREESGNQRAAIDRQCEEVQTVKAEIKAEVQKIEAGVQKVETEMQSMQLKFDEAHSKMDEKMDQLVKNIAGLLVVVST
jgi:hypothetical protein